MAPTSTRLPDGFSVRLAPDAKVCDDGGTLLGTSTGRLLYLRPQAAAAVDSGSVTVRDAVTATTARALLDRELAHPWWPQDAVPAGSATSPSITEVTVVVPVKDRPAALDRLLSALRGQYGAALPVVVVDDGSADDGCAQVARLHGAEVVRLPVNRGPAVARNLGFAGARTAYVAFLDSDVVPEPGCLPTVLRHFADPAVGLVAPRVLGLEEPPGTPRASWLRRYEAVRSSLDLGPAPALVRPGGRVAYVPSAALVVRGSAWGGGFEESMHVGEDVDFVWRMGDSGWRVRYEPAAQVRHEHRTDVSQWLRRKAFYGTSADRLAERHGTDVAPMVLTPWTLVLTGALLAQRRWSVPVAALAYGAATVQVSRRLTRSQRPLSTAAAMTATGAVAALWQTSAALTRHYWPVAAAAAVVSPRARRALLVTAVVDGVLDWRRTRPDLDPARYVVARRLDDLAYGTGVWAGALQGRSLRALRPALRGFSPTTPPAATNSGV